MWEWILMIIGIILFVYIGIALYIHSEKKQAIRNKMMEDRLQSIEQINTALDETIDQLHAINPSLEKVIDWYSRVFNKK